ncbi:MAG TPA: hypothetical protein DEF79_02180 [Gammaproteobacteria bacterium]|nr:hypothetical protein [Gammaproteobacteria bacterium]|tara:strand:- start:11159 stop:12154 length:996 start_codon:yes stop_codon:yes gene_type:complete
MNALEFFTENESLLSALAALAVIVGYFATTGKNFISQILKSNKTGSLSERLTLSELSAPSPHPIKYANSEGVNVAYSVFGTEHPTLIVTPGIISNLHVSSNLPPIKNSMDGLARFARVINFDKRGQGLSDPTISVATMEDRVSDIECVADASASDSFFLMGISEGGPMSVQYAVENPHRVRGLILFGTTPKFSRSDDFPMGFANKELDGLAESWGKGNGRHILFPSISAATIDDETYCGFEKLLADKRSMIQIVAYMKTLDVRPLLSKITCPTLIVHFTGDLAVPIRMGRFLHSNIPNSEFIELDGVDHCDLARSRNGVASIKAFIESVGY